MNYNLKDIQLGFNLQPSYEDGLDYLINIKQSIEAEYSDNFGLLENRNGEWYYPDHITEIFCFIDAMFIKKIKDNYNPFKAGTAFHAVHELINHAK